MATHEDIQHYRGDTFDRVLSISNYVPAETDIVKFGIRKTCDELGYLVSKTIDPTTLHIHLTSEETQYLPTKAVYDVQLTYADEEGISYTQTIVYGEFNCRKDVVRNE